MRESILFLSRREVDELLPLDDCVAAIEDAFRAHAEGKSSTPALLHVNAHDGEFHVKVGALPRYFALKANGGFFRNRERYGLPNIQGVIYLADARTGTPLAVMDSMAITVLRTGAATAVAAKYLARKDSASVLICGAGTQARSQLRALNRVIGVTRAGVWSQRADGAEKFATEMTLALGMPVTVAKSPDAAEAYDVVVTCTPSKQPFLRSTAISPGTFVAAVGADSPDKRELEPEVLVRATVVTDITAQCAEVGELHHVPDVKVHAELGEVITGGKAGRTSADEITVFDSTGTALQDVAAAALAYERAVEMGRGTTVSLY